MRTGGTVVERTAVAPVEAERTGVERTALEETLVAGVEFKPVLALPASRGPLGPLLSAGDTPVTAILLIIWISAGSP
jgi:hypothetical protein